MAALLAGMRIVESSAFVAVPLAGMTLAQMGADVIRVDRPGGGLDAARWPVTSSGQSLFWAGMNKGKRSLALDMTTPEGAEIMAALITAPGPDAGLFLTNLRGRGALDYPALSATRADLIMVSLIGTRRGEPAVDYTVNASLGFPMATGPEGSDPVAHVLPAWDLIAGGVVVQATLAAERYRLRHGVGQLAEMSLKDVAAAALGHLGIVAEVAVNGVDRGRAGNALYGAYGQDFICKCGGRLMVVGLTARQWRGLVKVTQAQDALNALGIDLTAEAARWTARTRITAILTPWFASRTLADITPLFDAAGLTWAPFRSFAGAVHGDPDLSAHNPVFTDLHQPGIGTYPAPSFPASFSALPRQPATPAPRLGAHSEEILGDFLGMGTAQIARLIDKGLVAV